MPMIYKQRESFPPGTAEEQVVQEQRLHLVGGAMASAYSGSQENGWSLITTWDLFGERGGSRRPVEVPPPLCTRH